MKSDKELFIEIMENKKKELLNSQFLLDFYEKELRNPKNVGKMQAKESIDIHKEANRRLSDTLKMYQDYLEKTYGKEK